jgi:hypothetical protein
MAIPEGGLSLEGGNVKGPPGGGNPNSIAYWVSALNLGSDTAETDGAGNLSLLTSIAFGATPATAGTVRHAALDTCLGRNATDTADRVLWSWTGNFVQWGDANNSFTTVAGGSVFLGAGGTNQVDVGAARLHILVPVEITNPADDPTSTTGDINFRSGGSCKVRDAADANDRFVWRFTDPGNVLVFGDTNNNGSSLNGGVTCSLLVGGIPRLEMTPTQASLDVLVLEFDEGLASWAIRQGQASAGAGVTGTIIGQAAAAASGAVGGTVQLGGGAGDAGAGNGFTELFTPVQRSANGAVAVETLAGDRTVNARTDPDCLLLDPDGVNRNVDLPVESVSDGLFYWIRNTGTGTRSLTVRDDSGVTTIVVLANGEAALVKCDGTTWFLILQGT